MHTADKLFASKPDCSQRLPKEERVYDMLDSLGIGYTGTDHAHADTIEDCLAVEKVLGTEICKNLFLCNTQKTRFHLLIMPGSKRFKTKDLSKQVGSSRLSFADAENMEKYLDITPGSVSILGLMNDINREVSVYIDRDLLKNEYLGFHPCINTSTLKIRLSDITEVFLPHFGYKPVIVELPAYTEEQ